MVKMINAATGTDMWVAEDRVREYQEAGHKLASDKTAPAGKPKTAAGSKKTVKK